MTATQTKLRRGTAAQVAAMTPVEGEMIINTTDDRPHIGDGSRPGGFEIPNFRDVQYQNFIAADGGGTGDAVEVTLVPEPLAWTKYMRIVWEQPADNTVTAPTLEIDGLGAKTIKKKGIAGKTALAVGDLQAGVIYCGIYDGTDVQLETVDLTPPSGSVLLKKEIFSGVAQVDFDGYFSSAYHSYHWELDILPATDNVSLQMLTKAVSGYDVAAASYAYDSQGDTLGTTGTGDADNSSSATAMILGTTNIGNAANEGIQATISIINPLGTARQKIFEGSGNSLNPSSVKKRWKFNGARLATAALSAVRFKASSGNISGVIRMFGHP
ncbi:MAG: hypothetical protein ACAH80_18585 [Alphaproteobacteria bacterium]